MIYTSYYSRPMNAMQGPGLATLGLGATASFGLGLVSAMKGERDPAAKLAMQNKIRGWMGLPPKTPATQSPAQVATATSHPVNPSAQAADPAQLPGGLNPAPTSPNAATNGMDDNGTQAPASQTAANAVVNPDDYERGWAEDSTGATNNPDDYDRSTGIPAPVDLAAQEEKPAQPAAPLDI